MATMIENPKSVCVSEGVKGVRILVVMSDGSETEFITKGNKYSVIKL